MEPPEPSPEFDLEKLRTLISLSRIPTNDGEQFICVHLNVTWGQCGDITYGFRHKTEMGTIEFSSLDEAITKVTELRTRANPRKE